MKLIACTTTEHVLAPSPRPIGRGLIEAWQQVYGSKDTLNDLPGQLAGASLKLLAFCWAVTLPLQSPRPIGRGLIEATLLSSGGS